MRSQLYRPAEIAEHPRPPSRSSPPAAPTHACWVGSSSPISTAERPWLTWRRRRMGRSPTAPW
jgi:hypothetical protein